MLPRKSARLFFFLCFISLLKITHAQINANFTASVQSGCSPLIVNFNNQSSGNITDYFWRFGNGNTSNSASPSATYISPGNYTVSLVINGAGGEVDSIIQTDFITVFENPEVDFSASTSITCLGNDISFSDLSTQSGGQINSWQWNFGDGNSSSLQNPDHTYQNPGLYTVSLEVSDINGCTGSFFKDNYINIVNLPQVDFSGINLEGCAPPHTAFFTSNSSGVAPLSYLWDFGDGGTSTIENPTYTYNSFGTFDVKLVVTDQSGCSDSLTKSDFVLVDQPVAEIGASATAGCSFPETTFQFSNQSAGPTKFVRWDFGDNSTANVQNPSKIYNSSGIYTVTLISGNNFCKDTTTETIYIQQLEADFDIDTRISCTVPFEANFTDLSTNAVAWDWDFGDNNVSLLQNPANEYQTEDTFNIKLSIQDSLGCISIHYDTVFVDVPELSIDTIENLLIDYCIPVDFPFVFEFESRDPAESYIWDFGNGDSSHQSNPIYTYADTNIYVVSLQITTELGCVVSDTATIQMGAKPTVFDAHFVEDTVCRGDVAELNITSDFADGYFGSVEGSAFLDISLIIDSSASVNLPGDFYTPINISGTHNNCVGNIFTFIDTMFLKGPLTLGIDSNISCANPFDVSFQHATLFDFQLSDWDFGDGNSSTVNFPTHTYSSKGVYPVSLTVTDTITGCTFRTDSVVKITDATPVLNISDTIGCRTLSLTVDGLQSQGALSQSWSSDIPDIDGKNGPGPHSAVVFTGDYSVTLQVTDSNRCTYTETKSLSIIDHSNQINASSTFGCVPASVDLSATVNADTSIRSFTWSIEGNTFSDSAITYEFTTAGVFNIALITTDEFGCSGTSVLQFTASAPKSDFTTDRQLLCIGDELNFNNNSTPFDDLDFEWDFGDGNNSILDTPSHHYASNDTYTISLIVTDIYGCKDTLVKTDEVVVASTVADFTISDSIFSCPPAFVNFTDLSIGGVNNWTWTFGNNSSSNIQNPSNSYNRPGVYDVGLIVQNNIGCSDSLFYPELIKVGGPVASFSVHPTEGCAPLSAEFLIYDTVDVDQITWDFGDGTASNTDTVLHQYVNAGVFFPNLIIQNDENCRVSFERIDTIRVDSVLADFSLSIDEACIPANFTATENSQGNIASWTWTVDNANFNGQTLAQQNFNSPGNYTVSLKVETALGCIDSTSKIFTAHPLPFVQISGDSILCSNANGQLFATENPNFTYQWMPEIGLETPNASSSIVSLNQPNSYIVKVTDANGCADTSDLFDISVFQGLDLFLSSDTTILIGDTAYLFPQVNQSVTNIRWSPSNNLLCDTCLFTLATPLEPVSYTVSLKDTANCSEQSASIFVNVIDDIKIAMPEVFTPNADDVNDVLYVKGWNIKELVYFRIFNRWGELIFETNDLNEGWDGTYKGEMQNMDSYAYVIKAISHKDREGELRGSVSLIR